MNTTSHSDTGPTTLEDDLRQVALEDIPTLVWTLLTAGVNQSKHPFHTPSAATTGHYGPSQRTVVLRHVDAKQRLVVCHTDRRSLKVRELAGDPRMSWHFYARELKLQIVLRGQATVHTDTPFADECWQRSTMRSRTCYNAPLAPGTTVPEPRPGPSAIEDDSTEATARSNFAAIACRVDYVEWLYLRGEGHRRAGIELNDDGKASRWLTP